MWERLIVLVLLVTPFCARAEGVLVLGDSISAAYGIEETQGWVHLLRQRLETQCSGLPVNNASVSGDTSDGGLVRLPDLLERHQPDTVVIELGGNDGLRGLPPQRLVGFDDAAEAGVAVGLLGLAILHVVVRVPHHRLRSRVGHVRRLPFG